MTRRQPEIVLIRIIELENSETSIGIDSTV